MTDDVITDDVRQVCYRYVGSMLDQLATSCRYHSTMLRYKYVIVLANARQVCGYISRETSLRFRVSGFGFRFQG